MQVSGVYSQPQETILFWRTDSVAMNTVQYWLVVMFGKVLRRGGPVWCGPDKESRDTAHSVRKNGQERPLGNTERNKYAVGLVATVESVEFCATNDLEWLSNCRVFVFTMR